jgi:pimeloyl-ACP methyl ester carboxylesterase
MDLTRNLKDSTGLRRTVRIWWTSRPRPLPGRGEATAAAIRGAKLVTFPGMGHDLPRELWQAIIGEIRTLADHACDRDRLLG